MIEFKLLISGWISTVMVVCNLVRDLSIWEETKDFISPNLSLLILSAPLGQTSIPFLFSWSISPCIFEETSWESFSPRAVSSALKSRRSSIFFKCCLISVECLWSLSLPNFSLARPAFTASKARFGEDPLFVGAKSAIPAAWAASSTLEDREGGSVISGRWPIEPIGTSVSAIIRGAIP